MKASNYLLILIAVVSLGFTSCKKCMRCTTKTTINTVETGSNTQEQCDLSKSEREDYEKEKSKNDGTTTGLLGTTVVSTTCETYED